jgi:hypothetical protein
VIGVEDLPPCYPLAREALRLAVRGERDAAMRTVEHLIAEHGPDAIGDAMSAWCDAVLAYLPPPERGDDVVLRIANAVTGECDRLDAFPAASQWAAQMIAARAADDRPMWDALGSSAPDDATWSLRVSALLLQCAVNVRTSKDLGRRPVHVWPMWNGG